MEHKKLETLLEENPCRTQLELGQELEVTPQAELFLNVYSS